MRKEQAQVQGLELRHKFSRMSCRPTRLLQDPAPILGPRVAPYIPFFKGRFPHKPLESKNGHPLYS